MLTGPRVLGSRFGPARRRALALGWRPCTRGLPLPTLAGVAALAALPSLVVLARHGRSYDGALVVAALALGAASAFAVDDPAEETLSTSPTPLALRRLLRLGSIVLGVALTSAVLVLVAAVSTPGGVAWADVARRGAELAATSGLAGAIGGLAGRRGAPWAAAGGAASGLLAVLVISSFAYRYHQLPALLDGPHHGRWWLIGAASWIAVVWTWRDPGRR